MVNPFLRATGAAAPYAASPFLQPSESNDPTLLSAGESLDLATNNNPFARGLARAAGGVGGGLKALNAAVHDAFGDSDQAATLYKAAQDEALHAQLANPASPGAQHLKNIRGLGDAAEYVLGGLGEAVPSMALGFGGGLLGRRLANYYAPRLAATPLAAEIAGGSVATLPLEAGEAALNISSDPEATANTTPLQRLGIDLGKGGINSVLEALVPATLASKTLGGAAERVVGSKLKHVGKEALKSGAEEAATEAVQEFVGQKAHQLANPNAQIDPWDIADAAAKGAIPGAHFGTVGGAVDALHSHAANAVDAGVNIARNGTSAAVDAGKALYENTDEGAKKLATYVKSLPPVNAETIGDVLGTAEHGFNKRLDSLKEKFGETKDDVESWMKPLAEHFDKVGWGGLGQAFKHTVDAVERDGLKGLAKVPEEYIQSLASLRKDLLARKQKLAELSKNDAASKALEAEKPADIQEGEIDLESRSTRGGDPVNKAVRAALSDLKVDKDFADRVADRINTNTVTFNGRSNVTKAVNEAVNEAITSLPDRLAAQFNNRELRERLVGAVRSRVDPAVTKALDTEYAHLPPEGAQGLFRDFVKDAFKDHNLSPDETDALAKRYFDYSELVASGKAKQGTKFVEHFNEQFGDRSQQLLDKLSAISEMVHGKGDMAERVKALADRPRQLGRIESEIAKHFNEATLDSKQKTRDIVGSMLSDMRTAYGRVKNKNDYEKADQFLKNSWRGWFDFDNPKKKTFEKVLAALHAYEGNPERVSSDTIGARVSDNAHEGARRVALSDEESEATDITDNGTDSGGDEKLQRKQENESGLHGSSGEDVMYHGVGVLKGEKHNRDVVQAPLSRHPSADYQSSAGTHSVPGMYNRAVEQTHAVYGHRMANGESVSVPAWAAAESERTGKTANQLMTEAMHATIAHDKERKARLLELKGSGEDVSNDIEWIDARAKLAERLSAVLGDRAGKEFFKPEGANRHYRYYKTTHDDAANIRFTPERLKQVYTPQRETTAQYYSRRVDAEGGKNSIAARNVVRDSMLPVTLTETNDSGVKETKTEHIDFARLVKDSMRSHQQADVEGVKHSMREQHSFRVGEDYFADAAHLINTLGTQQAVDKALAGNENFKLGLHNAVLTVLGALYDTKGVTSVGVERGIAASKAAKTSKGREFLESSGLPHETVIFRDFATGRIIRYGDISNFRGVDSEGNAKRLRGPTGTMQAHDMSLIAPATNAKITRLESVDPDKLSAAAARSAERGVLLGAVTGPDGRRRDLNTHELVNHMLERYGIDKVMANHETVMNKELAAVMLSEGVRELSRNGYKTDISLDTTDAIKKHADAAVVFKGSGADGERYPVKLGSLRNMLTTLDYHGSSMNVASSKDLLSTRSAVKKAQIASIMKQLEQAKQLRDEGRANPTLEHAIPGMIKRIDSLVKEIEFDPELQPAGQVADTQVNIGAAHEKVPNTYGTRMASEFFPHTEAPGHNMMEAAQRELSPTVKAPHGEQEESFASYDGVDTSKYGNSQPTELAQKQTLRRAGDSSGTVGVGDAKPTSMTVQSNQDEVFNTSKMRAEIMAARDWVKNLEAQEADAVRKANSEEIARGKTGSEEKAAPAPTKEKTDAELRAEKLAEMNAKPVEPVEPEDEFPFSKSTRRVEAVHNAVNEITGRLLGDLVNVEVVDGLKNAKGEEISGSINAAGNKILINAGMNPEGTAYHEIWHAVESLLKSAGPKGQQILDTVYKHTDSAMMQKWLHNKLTELGDDGAISQLGNQRERAAHVFQLYMEGHSMPLHSETLTRFQKIKQAIKDMLAKFGMHFTSDGDQTKAFFDYLNEGGVLRDFENPEAMYKALKRTGSDEFLSRVKAAYTQLNEGLDTVFGSTANRVLKMNNEHYTRALKMFRGEDGKGGYLGALSRSVNKFASLASEALASTPENERKNFAASSAGKKFMGTFDAYMRSRGMSESDIASVYDSLSSFDLKSVNDNFVEFTKDLQKYGGLDAKNAGDVRNIAQQISDNGFYDKTIFADHPEIARKWQSNDPKDYVARLIMTGVKKAERIAAFGENDVDLKKAIKAGDAIASPEHKALASKAFAAMEGTLGAGEMSREAQALTGWILTANNVRLLPLAVFSQLLEPMQLALRKNDFSAAFDALWRGVKELPRTFDFIDKKAEKDYWEKLAEQSGVVSSEIMEDMLSIMHNGIRVKGTAQWLNEKFFKYNFMSQWNRSMHIAATKHAYESIRDHANGVTKNSEEYLADLGLTKSDVTFEKGEMKVTPKIEAAIAQYVSEAMAHPDAGSNALWMNDPRFALLSQMKRFTFAHTQYVLSRVKKEYNRGNLKGPAIFLTLSVPWMMAADTLRDSLTGATKPSSWTYTDAVLHGIERTGNLGVKGSIAADIQRAVAHGSSPVEGLLGPTAELLGRIARMQKGNPIDALVGNTPGAMIMPD